MLNNLRLLLWDDLDSVKTIWFHLDSPRYEWIQPSVHHYALLLLCRYFWEESGPVCLGLHHSLPGPAHILHLPLQHHHEGERLIMLLEYVIILVELTRSRGVAHTLNCVWLTLGGSSSSSILAVRTPRSTWSTWSSRPLMTGTTTRSGWSFWSSPLADWLSWWTTTSLLWRWEI